jgi:hypothetical protein
LEVARRHNLPGLIHRPNEYSHARGGWTPLFCVPCIGASKPTASPNHGRRHPTARSNRWEMTGAASGGATTGTVRNGANLLKQQWQNAGWVTKRYCVAFGFRPLCGSNCVSEVVIHMINKEWLGYTTGYQRVGPFVDRGRTLNLPSSGTFLKQWHHIIVHTT